MSDIVKTLTSEKSGAYCNVYNHPTKDNLFTLQYYRSKRVKKPTYYLSNDVDGDISKLFKREEQNVEYKRKIKSERKVERNLKVGDILVSSTSCTMTLVNFYRVVELVGNMSVKVEEIPSVIIDGDSWSGHKVPNIQLRGARLDKTYRVIDGNKIKVWSYEYARLWSGKPMYFNSLD